MKKVLVIKTSPRKGGNSDMLADAFIESAKAAGNTVECVSLIGKTIAFCRGCLVCQTKHQCVINDDANAITDMMCDADVIVWATPVYYFSCCGQMKVMIDRANSLYARPYKFRDVYLLATAAEDGKTTVDGTIKATQGWVDCFEHATLRKTIFAGGVTFPKDIEGHKALDEARELGRNL